MKLFMNFFNKSKTSLHQEFFWNMHHVSGLMIFITKYFNHLQHLLILNDQTNQKAKRNPMIKHLDPKTNYLRAGSKFRLGLVFENQLYCRFRCKQCELTCKMYIKLEQVVHKNFGNFKMPKKMTGKEKSKFDNADKC